MDHGISVASIAKPKVSDWEWRRWKIVSGMALVPGERLTEGLMLDLREETPGVWRRGEKRRGFSVSGPLLPSFTDA